jgi:hypothetical protein
LCLNIGKSDHGGTVVVGSACGSRVEDGRPTLYQQSVTTCSLIVFVRSITRILHQWERSEDSGMFMLGPTLGPALRVSGIAAAVQRPHHDLLPEAGLPTVAIVPITDLSPDLI